MTSSLKKSTEGAISEEVNQLIAEAEIAIKKSRESKNPYADMEHDRKERAAILMTPLEYCVGKITVSSNCSQALLQKLSQTNLSPRDFIQKDWQ